MHASANSVHQVLIQRACTGNEATSYACSQDDLWIQLTNLEITLLTTEVLILIYNYASHKLHMLVSFSQEEAENFIMSFDTFHNQTASTLSEVKLGLCTLNEFLLSLFF